MMVGVMRTLKRCVKYVSTCNFHYQINNVIMPWSKISSVKANYSFSKNLCFVYFPQVHVSVEELPSGQF